jgi:hypothetical protein
LKIDAFLDFATDERTKVRAGFNIIDLANEQLQELISTGDYGRPFENRAIKFPIGDVLEFAAPSAVQLPGGCAHPGMLQRHADSLVGKGDHWQGCKTIYCKVAPQFEE